MEVKIIIGAANAYACITTPSTSLDIKLESGRSAQKSLREFANDQVERANRLTRMADLAVQAAALLERAQLGDAA